MRELNPNLVALVKLLNDRKYHDGTSIGHELNISRAAICKSIKKLKQYHVPLTSTKGKGYQLNTELLLLDKPELQSALRHHSVKVEVLEKIASTNDYLKSLSEGNQDVIACLAEAQTAGRGRLQRQWHSPFAENIYLSLLCPFEKDISEFGGLSLVVGLAVCHAIESVIEISSEFLKIKWPNDILLKGKKLAGTLIELQAESNGYCQAIIGVGINVNMKKIVQADIVKNWGALGNSINKYIDRNQLAPEIIDTVIDYLDKFSSQSFKAFQNEWQQRDYLINSRISLTSGKKIFKGLYSGVNQHGHLKLTNDSGQMVTFSSGDASVLTKPITD
jgi:BirA family biotin operon repressor/biotin-[acetyl-CoA-carboxylase] ligase